MRFYGMKSGKNHLSKFFIRSYNFNKSKNKKCYDHTYLHSKNEKVKSPKLKNNIKIIFLIIILVIVAVAAISISIISINNRNHDIEIQKSIYKLDYNKADDLNSKYYFSIKGNNDKWKEWNSKINTERRNHLSNEGLLKYYKDDYIDIYITSATHYMNQAWDYKVNVENNSNYKVCITSITFEYNDSTADTEKSIHANIVCNAKEKATKVLSTRGNGSRKDYGGSYTIEGTVDGGYAYSVSDFTFKIIHKK